MGFDVFSPTVLDIQIWAYFDLILEKGQGLTILKKCFPNFGKMTEDQFFHLKKYKFRILYCCLVAIHCFETALKNFGK